jgi:ABC-type sulfate/molybdate transport systems ATPase subunit
VVASHDQAELDILADEIFELSAGRLVDHRMRETA